MKQMIGKATKPRVIEIDRSQIRRLALAIGEDNPVHLDEAVAKAAGYPSLLATPTFPAALIDPNALLEELGMDPVSIMHRAEEYEYFRPLCAGDSLSVVHRIADIYDKDTPTGAIVFIIIETRGNDHKDRPVFKGRRTLVKLKS